MELHTYISEDNIILFSMKCVVYIDFFKEDEHALICVDYRNGDVLIDEWIYENGDLS